MRKSDKVNLIQYIHVIVCVRLSEERRVGGGRRGEEEGVRGKG